MMKKTNNKVTKSWCDRNLFILIVIGGVVAIFILGLAKKTSEILDKTVAEPVLIVKIIKNK